MSFVNCRHDGHVAHVELNRPDRMNAISTTLTSDLHAVLADLNRDPEVRAIILSGRGRAFCAGDDLKEFDLQTEDHFATVAHIEGIQRITEDLMFSDKFVVGAVHGYAVGGGFEWLLNCDVVVAAEDLIAFFPEMDWGQFPTGAVTHLLPQAVGYQRAMELLVLGERQNAAALQAKGLVNWVLPTDEILAKAGQVAAAAAAKSPFSVSRLKRLMTRGISGDLARALQLESEITIEAFGTQEARDRSANFPVGKNK